MEHPNLGDLEYFTVPPNFTRSDLEIKLDARGLLSYNTVNMALNSIAKLAASKGIPLRNSGASIVDEHIYPVTALVLEFLSFEMSNGNSKFTPTPPEAAIVPLLHETFDSQRANREKIEKLYKKEITKMLWTLGDMGYIGTMKENMDYWSKSPEDKHREKTLMKFEAIKHAPKIVQATCLADRLNNTLCLYSMEYLGAAWLAEPSRIERSEIRS